MSRDFQAPGRSMAYAANGMCATSHPHAARAAVDIMRAGGNAVDAGVAAALVLNIAEPAMTGLGGDCFALYKPANGPLVALNGSGRAPAGVDAGALRAEFGANGALPRTHGAAVTTPGAVAGLCRLQADHGRLDRAAVLAPGIEAAEHGVPVAPRAARDWAVHADELTGDAARRFYLKPDGAPYAAGDLFKAPNQAAVLRLIAAEGPSAFYEGPVAEDLLATMRAMGGAHRPEDLAAAAPDYVDPIATAYHGYDVSVPPPNGHGATALLMLDLVSALSRRGLGLERLDPFGADRAHLEAEVQKLAYDAAARFLSDPASIGAGLARMRAPETVAALAALIDPMAAQPIAALPSVTASVHKDTVYLSVVDRDGGALSLIYSIFHSFGSGVASERFGLLLHNRGAGFTLAAGHPNEIGPGKRPLHTIIPGMLMKSGAAVMPYGVMGGAYQPTGHARLLSNLFEHGLDLQSAMDGPRSMVEDGAVTLETGYGRSVAEQLIGKGHAAAWAGRPIGGSQAIWIDHGRGVLIGASDPRKDGVALGW